MAQTEWSSTDGTGWEIAPLFAPSNAANRPLHRPLLAVSATGGARRRWPARGFGTAAGKSIEEQARKICLHWDSREKLPLFWMLYWWYETIAEKGWSKSALQKQRNVWMDVMHTKSENYDRFPLLSQDKTTSHFFVLTVINSNFRLSSPWPIALFPDFEDVPLT